MRLDSGATAAELGIASAFQQPQVCENHDVSANIFLGCEMRQGLSVRDDAGMYAKAREVLNTLSTPVRAGQSIASLSGGPRQTVAIARTLLKAREVLNTLSTPVRAGQSIASLSGGPRQTVAIARTLLNNPSLIVLDEPTASLSVTQTAEVLDYIVRLRSAERSVIMVCHDLPNVFAIADRIVVMRHSVTQTAEVLDYIVRLRSAERSVIMVCHDLPNVFAIADRIVVMRHGAGCAVHATADTPYEEVIAEISGVSTGAVATRMRARASRAHMPSSGEAEKFSWGRNGAVPCSTKEGTHMNTTELIVSIVVGIGFCRVPAVRRWLLAQFPMLKPAEPQSPLRKAKPKKR